MRDLSAETFRQHLLEKYALPAKARARVENPANTAVTRPLRELWEATDLSAAEFADEVSDYWGAVRLGLPQLLSATPCLDGFSRRFLRESTIFPFRAGNGHYRIAVADPSDTAAIRAAEIVFGSTVEVAVASFEDITTVLDQRIEDEASADDNATPGQQQSDDDIESLRDLASGAPVVRAFNDLLERAVELRASDIHIEPFRAGLNGAHAGRRLVARDARADRRAAAGTDLAREDSGGAQYRRAAAAAGRRGARARQPQRT